MAVSYTARTHVPNPRETPPGGGQRRRRGAGSPGRSVPLGPGPGRPGRVSLSLPRERGQPGPQPRKSGDGTQRRFQTRHRCIRRHLTRVPCLVAGAVTSGPDKKAPQTGLRVPEVGVGRYPARAPLLEDTLPADPTENVTGVRSLRREVARPGEDPHPTHASAAFTEMRSSGEFQKARAAPATAALQTSLPPRRPCDQSLSTTTLPQTPQQPSDTRQTVGGVHTGSGSGSAGSGVLEAPGAQHTPASPRPREQAGTLRASDAVKTVSRDAGSFCALSRSARPLTRRASFLSALVPQNGSF